MKKVFFVHLFACMFWFCFLFFLEGCLHVFCVLFSVFIGLLLLLSTICNSSHPPSQPYWVKKSLFTSTIFIPSALLQTCILEFLYDYTSNRHLSFFFFLSCAHSRVISSPVLTTTKMHIFLGFILSFSLFQLSISLKLFLLCCLFLNVTMISTCLQKIECQTFCLPY